MKTMSELCVKQVLRKVQAKAIEMVAKWVVPLKHKVGVFYQTFAELKERVKSEKTRCPDVLSSCYVNLPIVEETVVSERQNTTSNTTSTKISEEQFQGLFLH